MKDIGTHEADISLVKKFLDYANCADASYALLEYIYTNAESDIKKNMPKADGLNFKDKLENDIEFDDKTNNAKYTKPKDTNTAYACAIEARFNEDRIGDWCIPFTNTCLTEKDKISNNDITKIGLSDRLSQRTITFTNRFRLLKHRPNTKSGFSATLFEDTEDNNQKIFAIRGTEFPGGFFDDMLDSDSDLMLGKLPSNQYIDMIKFYCECINESYITESTSLVIVGHSLGGCLAQLLTLSLENTTESSEKETSTKQSLVKKESQSIIKEVYTFNSPGAKNLKIDEDNLGKIYKIDSKILEARDKEMALFKKIRGYEYGEKNNFLRDSTLIGYDRNLFNQICKYFANNKNLKENYIILRLFTISSGHSISYIYEIFSVDKIFIKCLNTLKANIAKESLFCQDRIHHIKTDDDSNPDNNIYAKNAIQYLGEDIAGKSYYINLGEFSGSHFILPSIHALQRVLMLLNSGNIDNLLEYNKIKDLKDESMFLRINRDRKHAEQLLSQPNLFHMLY